MSVIVNLLNVVHESVQMDHEWMDGHAWTHDLWRFMDLSSRIILWPFFLGICGWPFTLMAFLICLAFNLTIQEIANDIKNKKGAHNLCGHFTSRSFESIFKALSECVFVYNFKSPLFVFKHICLNEFAVIAISLVMAFNENGNSNKYNHPFTWTLISCAWISIFSEYFFYFGWNFSINQCVAISI